MSHHVLYTVLYNDYTNLLFWYNMQILYQVQNFYNSYLLQPIINEVVYHVHLMDYYILVINFLIGK